jgi:hypothetical protein
MVLPTHNTRTRVHAYTRISRSNTEKKGAQASAYLTVTLRINCKALIFRVGIFLAAQTLTTQYRALHPGSAPNKKNRGPILSPAYAGFFLVLKPQAGFDVA